ncbi:MAG TPA: hypothetical protein VJ910_04000 [Desulfuromonadales bacterium]|nr:hypothetical protein [Desulfuromonadales bacterium]
MSDSKVTQFPKVPDVSEELEIARHKIRFILESTSRLTVKKPLSLEATIGLGVIIHDIDQLLAEIERKLGY